MSIYSRWLSGCCCFWVCLFFCSSDFKPPLVFSRRASVTLEKPAASKHHMLIFYVVMHLKDKNKNKLKIKNHLHPLYLQPHHSAFSVSQLSLRSSPIMTATQTRPTSASSIIFHPQPPDQSRLCGQCPRSCPFSAACRSSPVLESWCLSE